MNNIVIEKDIADLVKETHYFEPFENSSVLVTGATGLIGSILIKSLCKYNDEHNANIRIYACCRCKEKFASVFSDNERNCVFPLFGDIRNISIKDIELDYIIHGASFTDSKSFVEKPVETIDIAISGTKNLLEQCRNKHLKGFVYLSSLEVYGSFTDFEGIKTISENDSGYIDTMSVRSSYSESKRMVETLCASYHSQYGVSVKIARLCQTFGAGVSYNDNRVFAQFARSVIEKKNIVLRTKGETVRNYCYTTDAVSGILTVLAEGNSGEAYNIANEETTISIADMAKLVCTLYPEANVKVLFDLADDVSKLGYNPIVKIRLVSQKLQKLGWTPKIGIEEMFKRLIESMNSAE
ncbi:Nucleoside-diphosphate-sugar epimerase [Treponema sp. JC4]|uniref:NAD-dependent epimerase/dehydratase family protein n=1 Tax=Treponema sp. JC4 TaxID=1124982 RepID=UPI00025B0CDC|nr:NAD-dependent epimerase/dehydratase family protein [Treponema sp. JC4]EID83921.1 Nucleoside-diphosphate-sugar epimerase [Treponema sp. JC4]